MLAVLEGDLDQGLSGVCAGVPPCVVDGSTDVWPAAHLAPPCACDRVATGRTASMTRFGAVVVSVACGLLDDKFKTMLHV